MCVVLLLTSGTVIIHNIAMILCLTYMTINDLKIIPSKILIPYIMTDFFPFKISGWKRISKPGGTSVLSSVNT